MTIDKEKEVDILSEAKILLESKGYKVVKVQELRKRNPRTVCTLDENEDCAFCTWNECCDELEKMEKE